MRFGRWLVISVALCALSFFIPRGKAQEVTNCSLGKITERVAPQYPTFLGGRPAEGVVSVAATFGINGKISSSKVIAGPQQLRFESEAYVRGWRVEPSSEIRQCAIEIEYRFESSPRACTQGREVSVRAQRLDETHVLMHVNCNGF